MMIIPAIDILGGKAVRLEKGDYNSAKAYSNDPSDLAMQFEDAGLTRLHLVDLDGARSGEVKNWNVLETISSKTNLKIDFSGGLTTEKQLRIAFNSGASYTTIGSMAVRDETLVAEWIITFGAERFIIAADVLNEKVMIKGWTEETNKSVNDLIDSYKQIGVDQFICTDINCDGMMKGPSVKLYKKILTKEKGLFLIASGGVSSVKDISELEQAGCSAVIVGKAIYENKIKLSELC